MLKKNTLMPFPAVPSGYTPPICCDDVSFAPFHLILPPARTLREGDGSEDCDNCSFIPVRGLAVQSFKLAVTYYRLSKTQPAHSLFAEVLEQILDTPVVYVHIAQIEHD
jgi:hypothetical protein